MFICSYNFLGPLEPRRLFDPPPPPGQSFSGQGGSGGPGCGERRPAWTVSLQPSLGKRTQDVTGVGVWTDQHAKHCY